MSPPRPSQIPQFLLDAAQAQEYGARRFELPEVVNPEELSSLDTQLFYWHVVDLFQGHPQMAGFHVIDNAEEGEGAKETLRDLDVRIYESGQERSDVATPFHLREAAKETLELFRSFGSSNTDAFFDVLDHPIVTRSGLEEWGFVVLGQAWQVLYQERKLDTALSQSSPAPKPRF